MRLPILSLAVLAVLALSSVPAYADVIGNLGIDYGICCFGEAAAAYFGQSFVAPSGTLNSIALRLTSGSGPGDTHFRVLIVETTGGTGAGITPSFVVFESPTMTIPFDPTYPSHRGEYTDFSVALGDLSLTPNNPYAFILDGFVGYDGIDGSATSGMNINLYPDGHSFHYGGSRDGTRADHFANSSAWIDSVGLREDLAFEINFTPSTTPVPEPSTLTLLGLGMVGVIGYGWRRRVEIKRY